MNCTTEENRTSRTQEVASGLAASFLVIAVMSLSTDHWYVPVQFAYVSLTCACIAMFFCVQSNTLLRKFSLTCFVAATGFAVLFTLDLYLRRWESLAPEVPWVGSIQSWILWMGGIEATYSQGLLHIDHSEGAVSVRLSPEKTSIRWMTGFVVGWLFFRFTVLPPSDSRSFVQVAVAWIGWFIIRLAIVLWFYADISEILSKTGGGERLQFLCGFDVTALFVLTLGLVTGVAAPLAGVKSVVLPTQSSIYSVAGRAWTTSLFRSALVLVFLIGSITVLFLSLHVRTPGSPGNGRLLIDDRLCGQWEPAARLLDSQWYGDFSTYSFSSASEWLGATWSVDVNTNRDYDKKLLENYDVLILKTPEHPLKREEIDAILAWVKDGGGLLLVGDHTNLLGMCSQLNLLSTPAGIRFRYDAITPRFFGGFNRYVRKSGSVHPAEEGVEHLLFMTSCSLDLSRPAVPLLITGNCQSEPFDYANSSFFGTPRSYPETEYGPAVLSAVAPYGRGKVAAFTDSTVWSSFAIFNHNRDVFLNNLIKELNFKSSLKQSTIATLGIVGLVSLSIWSLNALVTVPNRLSIVAAIYVSGFWLAVWISGPANRFINAAPKESVNPPRVNFLWEGGQCAFPETLGSAGDLPASDSFDTFFVSLQRLGIVPKVAWTYAEAFESNPSAIVIIRPIWTPPKVFMDQLKNYVANGGHVFVVDELGLLQSGSSRDILNGFGVRLDLIATEDGSGVDPGNVLLGDNKLAVRHEGNVEVGHIPFGLGSIVYCCSATRFSREGMGHCFAVPWEDAKFAYEAVYTVFDRLFQVGKQERRSYGILE